VVEASSLNIQAAVGLCLCSKILSLSFPILIVPVCEYFVYLYLYFRMYFVMYVCMCIYVYDCVKASISGLVDPSCPVVFVY